VPRRKTIPWRALDAEALVLDVRSGMLYPLNSVAARIWHLCDGARDEEEIVRAIAAEFDAEEPVIRADVARFLDELAAAGLVTIDTRRGG
jgi:hypothetical protein